MPAPYSPAAERNQQPILEQLQRLLPAQGQALEIASGTGQHARHFVAGLPGWLWQPTEADPELLHWLRQPPLPARWRPPLLLDVAQPDWGLGPERFELVYCANLLHIAPWACCAGLMQGATRHLAPQGRLITYGPYLEAELPTAPSNLAFDADLRARHPAWGLRALADVAAEAARAGLRLRERVAMPANNLLLVFSAAGS
ncbi:MAG: DUF938 domain-containing protein [Inhella sp.]